MVAAKFIEEYTSCFGRLTWRVYEDEAGNRVHVCVRGFLARRAQTQTWGRAEARRRLLRIQGRRR